MLLEDAEVRGQRSIVQHQVELILPVWFQEVEDHQLLSSSMDSFFKAAVCDLDKLLDDFELNTGETTSSTLSSSSLSSFLFSHVPLLPLPPFLQ